MPILIRLSGNIKQTGACFYVSLDVFVAPIVRGLPLCIEWQCSIKTASVSPTAPKGQRVLVHGRRELACPLQSIIRDFCAWCAHVCESWVAGLPRFEIARLRGRRHHAGPRRPASGRLRGLVGREFRGQAAEAESSDPDTARGKAAPISVNLPERTSSMLATCQHTRDLPEETLSVVSIRQSHAIFQKAPILLICAIYRNCPGSILAEMRTIPEVLISLTCFGAIVQTGQTVTTA